VNKTKLDYIISMMAEQPMFSYYAIHDGNDNVIYDQQNDTWDSPKAIKEIKNFFANNEGIFTVTLRNKRIKTGNGYRELGAYTVVNMPEMQPQGALNGVEASIPINNGTFGSSSDIQALIAQMQKKDERIQELIHSNFLALMDEKNKQFELRMEMMKAEKSDPNAPFNQAALQALTGLFGGGGMPQINGLGDVPLTAIVLNGNDTQQRINLAVRKLLKIDDNFVIHIEKLAKLAEQKPQIYKMAINQLNTL
jgi:hypothetical protein